MTTPKTKEAKSVFFFHTNDGQKERAVQCNAKSVFVLPISSRKRLFILLRESRQSLKIISYGILFITYPLPIYLSIYIHSATCFGCLIHIQTCGMSMTLAPLHVLVATTRTTYAAVGDDNTPKHLAEITKFAAK
jgi:hypothetical protein